MNKKVAYFIDTFFEINGVAKTSQALLEQCAKEGREFKFITTYKGSHDVSSVSNFKPIISMPLSRPKSFMHSFAEIIFLQPFSRAFSLYALFWSVSKKMPLASHSLELSVMYKNGLLLEMSIFKIYSLWLEFFN